MRERKSCIISSLKKLALGMEALGRNYINKNELSNIIDDRDILKLLLHGTLITINAKGTDEETWQFEHNNFQEYLAATALSNAPLVSILDFIKFDKETDKIIPSWGNTVNFLVSIRKNEDLLDWILKKEPEMLIRSEKDKFTPTQRIDIFKNIFNKYKEKKIWIDDRYFRYRDLAHFAQSNEIIEFLLSQNSPDTYYTALTEAIVLLGKMKISDNYREKVSMMFFHNATDPAIAEVIKYRALLALAKQQNLQSETLIDNVVEALIEVNSPYIRAGLYELLNNSQYHNKHIDVYLEGIKYLAYDPDSSRIGLVDESHSLSEGLKKARGAALKKVIQYINENFNDFIETFAFSYNEDGEITLILENAIEEYKTDKTIFDSIFQLLRTASQAYCVDFKNIITFFEQTRTTKSAIEKLLKEEMTWDTISCIALLADKDIIENICSNYPDVYDAWFIDTFLNALKNNQDKTLYEVFYKKINKISNNRFDIDSPQKIKKANTQKDFDLFFDKNTFLYEIKEIFKSRKSNILTCEQLIELRNRGDNDFSLNVIYEIERLALDANKGKDFKKAKVTLDDSISFFEKPDYWKGYSTGQIYKCLIDSQSTLCISAAQSEYICEMYNFYLKDVDFKNALQIDDEGRISRNRLAVCLNYFFRRFNFVTSKEILFDMLYFDTFEKGNWIGIKYLEELKQLPMFELKAQINVTKIRCKSLILKEQQLALFV